MSDLQVFNFKLFPVRAGTKDGVPMIVAVDVCNALGLEQVTRAMDRLDDDERGLLKVTHPQAPDKVMEVNAITEAGLYQLVIASNKPEAREFKRWIAHEVLPSIRKHGGYVADTEKFVDSYFQSLPAAARLMLVTALDEGKRLNEQLAIAAPKVEGYDKLMSSADCVSIGEVAKLLGTGQNRLFDFLRFKKVLIPESNLPYQPHIDAGRFKIIEQTWGRGVKAHISPKTLVTPKGIEYIRKIWETVGAS